MDNLIKVNKSNEGNLVVSSREVAENFGKKNKHINESIKKLMVENSTVRNMFIENTYISDRGRKEKEYLLTRDGFSLIVMGFTGYKALEWKLKYINAFNKMEEHIKNSMQQSSYLIDDPIERAKAWIKEQEERKLLTHQVEELSPLAELARERLDKTGTVSITDVTKTYNLKRGQLTTWAKVKGYIHKTIHEVNKAGEDFFKVVDANGYKNVAIKEGGIREIDKNIEDIKTQPTSFKKLQVN